MSESCDIWFYHLERSRLDQVLPDLLEKTLARGWRAIVRTADPAGVESLDTLLWTYRDDSFLPHAPADDPAAARQPILITADQDNPNGAQALFLVEDAAPGDLTAFARCIVIFDGTDPEALQAARRRWVELKARFSSLSYWKQTARGWEKQA